MAVPIKWANMTEAQKERVYFRHRIWRANNRDKARAATKRWEIANAEHVKAKRRERGLKNRAKENAYNREHRRLKPEMQKARNKRKDDKNRLKIRVQQKVRYERNKDHNKKMRLERLRGRLAAKLALLASIIAKGTDDSPSK
jgi:hypothetical protein